MFAQQIKFSSRLLTVQYSRKAICNQALLLGLQTVAQGKESKFYENT